MGGKSSKTKEPRSEGRGGGGDSRSGRDDRRSAKSGGGGGARANGRGGKAEKGEKGGRSGSGKSEDRGPAVRQVLGHWETHLSNCNAMAVDGESGHIAVGGRGADMKNYIRVYDLQGNVVGECGTTDNSPVRGLAVVRRGSDKRLAIIYHQPAFKPATIEVRDARDLSRAATAYNATTKPAEEMCATARGMVVLNTDKSPKFKCLTELFWAEGDAWKLKPRPDVSAPFTVTTDEKNPLGVVFGLGSVPAGKGGGGGGGDFTLLCIASYSSLSAYTLQATGSGRESWTLRATGAPDSTLPEGRLRYPCDICTFGPKTCLVVDQSLNNVSIFSVEGKGSFQKVLAGEKERLDKPRSVGFLPNKGTLVVLNKEGAEIRLLQVK